MLPDAAPLSIDVVPDGAAMLPDGVEVVVPAALLLSAVPLSDDMLDVELLVSAALVSAANDGATASEADKIRRASTFIFIVLSGGKNRSGRTPRRTSGVARHCLQR